MFEGLLERVLVRIFGNYVEEFNPSSLHLSVWNGNVELSNVRLKASLFDSIQAPFHFHCGVISKLQLKIPWTKLNSAPVQLTVDGVYVLLSSVAVDDEIISVASSTAANELTATER